MDGYETYKLFTALKLHFNSDSYDYFKYNGKTNFISQDSFRTHKNKFSFYKLSRRYSNDELIGFLISNLIRNSNLWIGDLSGDVADDCFASWKKITQSLSYIFNQDLDKIFDSESNVFKPGDAGEYPVLLELLNFHEIRLETVVILNDLLNFLPVWEKKISDDVIFPTQAKRIKKYSPFMQSLYDKTKFKETLKNKAKENVKN